MYHVEIKKFDEMQVAALAHRGPYPQIGSVFSAVADVFSKQELWGRVTGPAVGFYYDAPDASMPRAYAGMIVSAGPAPLETVMIAAGRYAVLRHIGPYDGLPAAWDWLYRIGLAGLVVEGAPPFEMNPNGPMDAVPADFITDICVKLR